MTDRVLVSTQPPQLTELRARLDTLDDELVDLIERRAAIVDEVVRAKAKSGVPTFVPAREAEIVARALRRSRGIVRAEDLVRVIHEVLAASRARALVPRVAYLGPEGSMSHAATLSRFGPEGGQPYDSLDVVVEAVAVGEVELGVVPVENSTTGAVREGLEPLSRLADHVQVVDELIHHVRYVLWAASARVRPRRVWAHPQAWAQCAVWRRAHLPDVELVSVSSSSRAVVEVARVAAHDPEGQHHGDVALASPSAGLVHGLVAIAADVHDRPDNHTRFVIIARNLSHLVRKREVKR